MKPEDDVDLLLVEDNPHDAELAIRALRKHPWGQHLHHVEDGAEALDFLFRAGRYAGRRSLKQPRLVLLDLKLPKVDGVEVLRRLKADDRLRSIPIVVLTSSREERDLRECYRLGANSYIVKPVDFDQFKRSLEQVGLYWIQLNELPDPECTP